MGPGWVSADVQDRTVLHEFIFKVLCIVVPGGHGSSMIFSLALLCPWLGAVVHHCAMGALNEKLFHSYYTRSGGEYRVDMWSYSPSFLSGWMTGRSQSQPVSPRVVPRQVCQFWSTFGVL